MEPQNKDYQRGQTLTLADAGHYDSALVKLKQPNSGASDKANLLAEAYIYKLAGQYEGELRVMTRLLPENALMQQYPTEYVQALRNNQLVVAIDNTNLMPDIRADIHAELIRLSFMPARSESKRYAIADCALAQYAALEIPWHDNSDRTVQYQRTQADHLGALLTRDRYKDVISHYQCLKNTRQIVLPWAQYWTASAYLKEQQPKKAQSIMTELFYHKETIAPDLSDEELADLFYSHLGSENYLGALTVTQHTTNTSPPFLQLMDTPTSIPNDTRLQGHPFLSIVAKYSNDPPQTEMIVRELAYNAPGNQGLRIDYASVLQARGRHRAAENELKKAGVIEPRNINLEVEQAWTASTLQEWQQTAVLTYDVVEREPQDPGVVRLKRTVSVHNLAELRIAGSTGTDVEGPDNDKHDVDLTTIVYSPPLKDDWRGFAGFGYADGQFSEGRGTVRNWLAGVEWRSRNIWLGAGYAECVFNHKHKPGTRLSGWYDFNDNWRIGSQLERLSHRVPLRAMKNGVIGNSAQAYVRWYQNKRHKYGVSWAFTDLSGSNQRQEVSLEGQERIWSSSYLTIDFLPNLYYEQSTEHDTPYYNPIKTFDVVPAFEASHLLWRSYKNSWEQIFSVGVGAFWQKHYGTDVAIQLGYGQRISWDGTIDIGATPRWEKRPYNGGREHNLYVEFDVTFRF